MDAHGVVGLRLLGGGPREPEVAGAVIAQTSFDDVDLRRIGGPADVTIEHGGLKAHGLEKGLKARVSGDGVVLEEFRGPVDVEVQRAGIEIAPADALVDPVTASATHGAIRLSLPRGSRSRPSVSGSSAQRVTA